jgi:hypothetical protein
MAIYKKDLLITPDGTRHGKQLTGDEIRMPYRVANSITQNGMTYAFSHMDNGEAVYVKGGTPLAPVRPFAPNVSTDSGSSGERTIQRADLPPGAILHSDFVGRFYTVGNRRYRMMQPVTKCDGMFVLVEAQP